MNMSRCVSFGFTRRKEVDILSGSSKKIGVFSAGITVGSQSRPDKRLEHGYNSRDWAHDLS